MSSEIHQYKRPDKADIAAMVNRLSVTPEITMQAWSERIARLANPKSFLYGCEERMLSDGMFAGWEVDDLLTLRGLISNVIKSPKN